MSQVEHHKPGIEYWRSLQQLADTPEVRQLVEQEFPGYDASSIATSSRRKFLKIMGASMALAGLTLSGCRRWPKEKLAPYTASAGNHTPGMPEQYATAMELSGVAQPLLVTSFDGRPIKIEGNPTHPFSVVVKGKYGSADAFAQASVLEMYDPQRSREIIDRRTTPAKASNWKIFSDFVASHFGPMKGSGAGLAILMEATSSPTVQDMKARVGRVFPQARWYEYEAVSRDSELEGSRLAFGRAVRSVLHLDKAKVIVSLDEDLVFSHPAHIRYASDWSQWRRRGDHGEMNRLYIAETSFSVTGTIADARLPVDPARLFTVASAIAAKLGVPNVSAGDKLSETEQNFVDAAASDLKGAGRAGVLAAGPTAAPVIHALVHAINQHLGAVGTTVTLLEDPAGDRPTHMSAVMALAKDMHGGNVKTLLILGGNPAYDAPFDAQFAKALEKVPVSIRLGLYHDETSNRCTWHLPRAHYLESWGDARAWDGSANICQPLIEPLFGGKSIIEVLALLINDSARTGDEIVKRTWKEQFISSGDFDKEFRKTLEAGIREGTAYKTTTATVGTTKFDAPATGSGMFLRFDVDSHAYDGRFANNGWLQETGDPLTKLVWDNAAIFSKKDADTLGVKQGDVVRIDAGPRSIEAAAFILPGQPIGVIRLSLGYGRTGAGSVGSKLGFNAYTVRMSGAAWFVSGVKVTSKGSTYTLATTMEHHILDPFAMKNALKPRIGDKNETGLIIHEATLDEFKKDHHAPHAKSHDPIRLQLFEPPHQFDDPHAWGMAVDLNACIGCNACVVACQAENNVPIVGKDQVLKHREMQWIRIDRYFKGDADDPNPHIVHQPMMCVHCENAPCEQVCPVAATVHDSEGLNTMVYNRCIGTRYCSNNCPYKVRRFNYFDFHSKDPRDAVAKPHLGLPDTQQEAIDKIKRMVFNPEVTVRMRGVMEKCTYCTQRIHHAKVQARNAGQDVKDGDVLTACQQACPTQAIVFGNLKDSTAQVVDLHKNARSYEVLGELNVRPRTKYLAKLRNPPTDGKPESAEPRTPAH